MSTNEGEPKMSTRDGTIIKEEIREGDVGSEIGDVPMLEEKESIMEDETIAENGSIAETRKSMKVESEIEDSEDDLIDQDEEDIKRSFNDELDYEDVDNRQSTRGQSTLRPSSIRQSSVRQSSIRQSSVRQSSVKSPSIRESSSIRQSSVRPSVRQSSVRQSSVSQSSFKDPSIRESSTIKSSTIRPSTSSSSPRRTVKQSQYKLSEDDYLAGSPRQSELDSIRSSRKSLSGESTGSRGISIKKSMDSVSASLKSSLKSSQDAYQKSTVDAESWRQSESPNSYLGSNLKISNGSRITDNYYYDDEIDEEDDFFGDTVEEEDFNGGDGEGDGEDEDDIDGSNDLSDPGSGINFDDDLMESTLKNGAINIGHQLKYLSNLLLGPTLADGTINNIHYLFSIFGNNSKLSYADMEDNFRKIKEYDPSKSMNSVSISKTLTKSGSQLLEGNKSIGESQGISVANGNGSRMASSGFQSQLEASRSQNLSSNSKRRTQSECQLFSETESAGSMSKKLSRSKSEYLSESSRLENGKSSRSRSVSRNESKFGSVRGSSQYRSRTYSRGESKLKSGISRLESSSNSLKLNKSEAELSQATSNSAELFGESSSYLGKISQASGDKIKNKVTFMEPAGESGENFNEDYYDDE